MPKAAPMLLEIRNEKDMQPLEQHLGKGVRPIASWFLDGRAALFYEQLGPKKKTKPKITFQQLGREKANTGENLRTQAGISELGQKLFFWLFGFEFWNSFEISFAYSFGPYQIQFDVLPQLLTSLCEFWLPSRVRVGWVLKAKPGRLRPSLEAWILWGTTTCRWKIWKYLHKF